MRQEVLLDHGSFVREIARGLTFGSEDPDDVVQETWLKAIESPPTPGPDIRGWLATVARNVVRQSRRSRLRRVAREGLREDPRPIPTPEEIREREETRREVVEAVLALDEPGRTAVILRYYEDLPPREIAARLDVPVETVKTRLVRARGKLRARLDQRHGGDGKRWGTALMFLADPVARRSWLLPAAAVVGVAAALLLAVGVTAGSTTSPDPEPAPDVVALASAPAALGQEEEEPADPAPLPPAAAKKTAVVEGTVLDEESGKPVPLVTVRIHFREEGKRRRGLKTRTDREGRYRFTEVPAGIPAIPTAGRRPSTEPELFEAGRTYTRELRARSRPGVVATFRFELSEGVDPPAEVKVISRLESDRGGMTQVSMDWDDYPVDPAGPAVHVFLPQGTNLIGFEAPGLMGDLPPRVVDGDGAPVTIPVKLIRWGGIRVRLVDEGGEPVRRPGVRVATVHLITETYPGGSNSSIEMMGTFTTNERGEVEVPDAFAPNPGVRKGYAYGFTVTGADPERKMMTPTVTYSLTEVLDRAKKRGADPVLLDVPDRDWIPVTLRVRDAEGNPASGVPLVGVPAENFKDAEYVTDARGEVVLRLATAEKMRMGPPKRETPPRPRVEARAPWLGAISVAIIRNPDPRMVGYYQPQGGPPGVLVVGRAVRTTLRLVDDLGEPIADAEVTIDQEKVKTDADGRVERTAAETGSNLTIQVPGHLPVQRKVLLTGEGAEVVMDRARDVAVAILLPDGTRTFARIHAVEPGKKEIYRMRTIDRATSRYILSVPHRTVKVIVVDHGKKLAGEALVGPDQEEVEITLSPE